MSGGGSDSEEETTHTNDNTPSSTTSQSSGDMLLRASKSLTRVTGRLRHAEPLVTFALSHATQSSPTIRVYDADSLYETLQYATREYLDIHVKITEVTSDKQDGIRHISLELPRLLRWYGRDFATTTQALVEWLAAHVGERHSRRFSNIVEGVRAGTYKVSVRYAPWDASFRLRFEEAHNTPSSVTSRLSPALQARRTSAAALLHASSSSTTPQHTPPRDATPVLDPPMVSTPRGMSLLASTRRGSKLALSSDIFTEHTAQLLRGLALNNLRPNSPGRAGLRRGSSG
eukprot:CAMPEP_0168605164 /NCGR_PEP_ID=MMETSP0420-20121227/15775_1 /TAXON_ID=498008 /ORGANISM="Pessonella sp." /LENGTH=286 /DNA_ID=CAMNT_0008644511 /DNA_START=322 /DNA_END=1182 /DNA_ORIENTATION=-